MNILNKKEREKIFELFLNNNKLKFNEIEKNLDIRSNMVSYHLEQMVKENILEKKEMYYYLTKEAETYIPIFQHIVGKELSPLPVVLIATIKDDKIVMVKRNKRPYKNYWSMIGGKMLFDETIEEASIRQVKRKTSLDAKFISTNHILHEMVDDNGVKHSFILFFVKVSVESNEIKDSDVGELKWFSLEEIKEEETIPSDYWLIKNKLDSIIDIDNAQMKDIDGRLKEFKII
ncbi:NUDIX domain-containing protein [Candidatus Woesearchaeota archaeon]|nr:NUDIX domain-containing protein [Candidatus Woesearchaeota archaeon]